MLHRPETNEATASAGRIIGLDSIRFLCATVVVIGHFGLFPGDPNDATGMDRAIRGGLFCLFNGPAAVIVFFVVSGFCIHYPFRNASRLNVAAYLSRRMLRIGLPALACIAYSVLVLKSFTPIGVLWSIVCEIIYYCLYPLLLLAARRTGWLTLVSISYVTAVVMGLTHLSALKADYNSYAAFGLTLTWVIGLPCWLLGCFLAENLRQSQPISTAQLWALRGGVYLLSVVFRVMKFHVHSPLGSNVFTLNLFAIVVAYWIAQEIAYYRSHKASKILESAGSWSYSIYLAHPLAGGALGLIGLGGWDHSVWTHGLNLLVVFLFSYLFFLLIEWPSHRLATRVGRALKNSSMWVITVPCRAPGANREEKEALIS